MEIKLSESSGAVLFLGNTNIAYIGTGEQEFFLFDGWTEGNIHDTHC